MSLPALDPDDGLRAALLSAAADHERRHPWRGALNRIVASRIPPMDGPHLIPPAPDTMLGRVSVWLSRRPMAGLAEYPGELR